MDLIGQVLLNTIHYLHYCEEHIKNQTRLQNKILFSKESP